MAQVPFGHRIGALLAHAFRPITFLYSWWKSTTLKDGTTYYLMPDGMAILVVILAPLYVIPTLYFFSVLLTIAVIMAAPFVFLSALKVRNGEVLCAKLFLFIPYWVTRIPVDGEFEIYQVWEDAGPSGVAFTLTHKAGEYLHLGTAATAVELERVIGTTLKKQGWVPSPKNRLALVRSV